MSWTYVVVVVVVGWWWFSHALDNDDVAMCAWPHARRSRVASRRVDIRGIFLFRVVVHVERDARTTRE